MHGRRAVGAVNLHSPHEFDIRPEQATWLLQLGRYIAGRLGELQGARRLAAMEQPVS